MKMAIVGNGGAGLPLSLFLKNEHPEFDISLIDKNEKIGRKLCATGNGKCNILNLHTGEEHYNNPAYMKPLLAEYNFGNLMGYLANLGVVLSDEGDYVYPVSKSAPTLVNYFGDIAKRKGIRFLSETKVLDYEVKNGIQLKTNKGTFSFDKVVFATGGKSSPNLGSDGSMFPIFEKHGYQIEPLRPSLCPIRTVEKTSEITGYRHQAKVTLMVDGRIVREEEGEVIFKNDGLSGIVIFNMSAIINRLEKGHKIELDLDLFPAVTLSQLTADLLDAINKNGDCAIEAYFPKEMASYLKKAAHLKTLNSKGDAFALAKAIKCLRFNFKESYDFASSQVSIGGIRLSEVNADLSSKKEANVYFAGEVLDIDGLCGGHNLTWCLISALLISNSFSPAASK